MDEVSKAVTITVKEVNLNTVLGRYSIERRFYSIAQIYIAGSFGPRVHRQERLGASLASQTLLPRELSKQANVDRLIVDRGLAHLPTRFWPTQIEIRISLRPGLRLKPLD